MRWPPEPRLRSTAVLSRLRLRGRHRRDLADPIAAQGRVQIDERAIAVAEGGSQRQLRREQAAFGVEHVEIVGITVVVALAREHHGTLQRRHAPLQRSDEFAPGLDRGQCIVDIAECVLDGLPIRLQRLLAPRLRLPVGRVDGAAGEDRAEQLTDERPGARRSAEQVIELAAGAAAVAGQRERRKIERARRAHQGIGRDQLLLGLQDVGTPGKQFRRQAARYRRHGQGLQLAPALDRAGIATDQHRQGMFLLGDGLSKVRNRARRALVFRDDLHHLVIGDHAAFEAKLEDIDTVLASSQCPLGDLEATVQVEQGDIAGDDGRHQRQRDAEPCLLRRQQIRARGFVLAANASPQVQFPTRGQQR